MLAILLTGLLQRLLLLKGTKLQAAWDALTPIQRKNLRADELAWIKAKDKTVMGFDRIQMIKDRTDVLTHLGNRFTVPK